MIVKNFFFNYPGSTGSIATEVAVPLVLFIVFLALTIFVITAYKLFKRKQKEYPVNSIQMF